MTKEQLAEQYCNKIYQEAVKEDMYAPDVYQSKKDFIAGFTAAEPKWISVEDKTPEYNKQVLVKDLKGKEEVITQGYFQDVAQETADICHKSAVERGKFSENGIETVEYWRNCGYGLTWFDYAGRQIQSLVAKTSKNKVITFMDLPQ
jgi:hypothetical protein